MARTRKPQDSQRGKAYAAENGAAWEGRALNPLTERQTRVLVGRMIDWLDSKGYSVDRPVYERVGKKSLPVITVSQSGGAYVNKSQSYFRFDGTMSWGTTRMVFGSALLNDRPWAVAHEVAHLVQFTQAAFPGREWDADGRSHGWEWANVYLALVRRFYGVANYKALKAAFKAGKVKHTPKRRMSDEARAAAAARLAAHRLPVKEKAREVFVIVVGGDEKGPVYRARSEGSLARFTTADGRQGVMWAATRDPAKALWRVNADKLDADDGDALVRLPRELVDA
jgi:hypothetical protein